MSLKKTGQFVDLRFLAVSLGFVGKNRKQRIIEKEILLAATMTRCSSGKVYTMTKPRCITTPAGYPAPQPSLSRLGIKSSFSDSLPVHINNPGWTEALRA